ncbi:hypothetical protein SVIOM74S_03305 [Streptomyces violarus]
MSPSCSRPSPTCIRRRSRRCGRGCAARCGRTPTGTAARPAWPPCLAGVPLPAKANLLTRWERKADRAAGYVRLPSPLGEDVLLREAKRSSR